MTRETKSAPPSLLRTLFLSGAAGKLEALLDPGKSDPGHALPDPIGAPCSVLVCHPHPLGGGSMHNKVVYHAARVFRDLGWPTLRFNFRGVGLSQGTHHGEAEVEDVCTALEWLDREFQRPVLAAGFSFGAAMALRAAHHWPSVAAFLGLGLPLQTKDRSYAYPEFASWPLPALLLSGDRDPFATPDQLAQLAAVAGPHVQLKLVPGADHFFAHRLDSMQDEIRRWLNTLALSSQRDPLPAGESTT